MVSFHALDISETGYDTTGVIKSDQLLRKALTGHLVENFRLHTFSGNFKWLGQIPCACIFVWKLKWGDFRGVSYFSFKRLF